MADTLTAAQRSACMAAVRGTHTRPEMRVRRLVHALGYRYALHKRSLPCLDHDVQGLPDGFGVVDDPRVSRFLLQPFAKLAEGDVVGFDDRLGVDVVCQPHEHSVRGPRVSAVILIYLFALDLL